MRRVDLTEAAWTIEVVGDLSHAPAAVRGRTFPARVPGCVHSDLIRAGVIGHPDLGFNEETCQWIGRCDWRYRCRFGVDVATLAHERVDLVLDGLDTIATIELNGERAGEAMNMHHAHRFDIKPLAREGHNEIVITLRGPITYVEEQKKRLGSRPVNGDWLPYSYVRKMASNFQWDWGPRVATCGIWRAARLEAWSGARIAGVRPIVLRAGDAEAAVRVDLDIESSGQQAWDFVEVVLTPLPQTIRREHQGIQLIIQSTAFRNESASTMLTVRNPALWWPRGFGQQRAYALQAKVHHKNDCLNEARVDFGIRTTRLVTRPDEHGESFAVEVNGVPIFCKGANWIPEGLFPEDQTPERICARVHQAAGANMNMLRVWGGGAYEQEAFYDACDELGIMVWQDFMFACATYPEGEPYPHLIEREAREAVTRLAHHPSIVLWCGGNENVLGYESWGWKQRMPAAQKWGERYFFDILPRVVKELDPSRPYWPDSPHSAAQRAPAIHPNDPDRGDRHTWDAKIEGYRDVVPRFCSEFGHQSPPCWATMREMWGEDQLRLDSRAMTHRQRATGGNEMWYGEDLLGRHFAAPRNFDEWLYLAHLLQARAMSIGIEWLRANRPRCMGALFWQLNDAWAGHSWSCIDSAGRKKPAWYAIRRSFAPRLLTIQPFDRRLRLCAINDEADDWNITARVRRMRMDGATLAERIVRLSAGGRAVQRSDDLASIVGEAQERGREFIVVDETQTERETPFRACWFFERDRELPYPEPRLHTAFAHDGADLLLTLRAESLLRDVVISANRVDPRAEADDNVITLLPGEQRCWRICAGARIDDSDAAISRLSRPPVLMCANGFGARRLP